MKEVSLAATEGQTPQPTPPRGGRINLFGGLVVVILLVGALFVSGLGGAHGGEKAQGQAQSEQK